MATILIVDDEEPVRAFLAMLLQAAGYRVLLAIHGVQAMNLIHEERPDLVISDIMMPVMNGVELCRGLKAGAETMSIPVILMSAAEASAADGAGADAFIAKPFELDQMETLVKRWTPSERGLAATANPSLPD
jgi:CheY-like chemotaxis protein